MGYLSLSPQRRPLVPVTSRHQFKSNPLISLLLSRIVPGITCHLIPTEPNLNIQIFYMHHKDKIEESEPIKLTPNYQPNNKSKVKTPILQNNPRNIYPNLLILLKIFSLVPGTNPHKSPQIPSNFSQLLII